MKQLLINAIVSLVTGFCFVGGAIIAINMFEIEERERRTYVDEPQGFEFLNHKRVEGQAQFTVRGVIKNTTDTEWDNVQLFLNIYAGEAYLTYCRNGFDYLAPISERKFTIVCDDVSGHNIPENVTYKLSVARAAIQN